MAQTRRRFIFNIPDNVYEELVRVSQNRNMAMSVYVLQALIESLAHEVK